MLKNLVLDRPLAVLDLETTGTDPVSDRICEISVLKLHVAGEFVLKTCRINPGIPIPPTATAVHGITDADVADKPTFARIADRLVAFLEGCDLCGYNLIRYDLRLLLNEFARCGVSFPVHGRCLIDPCRIYHDRERRDLTAALRFYCGIEHEGAHGAEADVKATVAILDAQVSRYEDLPKTVGGLHEQLRDPKAVDLGEFFARRDDGGIVFAKGKYKGQSLDEIARLKPDYLGWMLGADFLDDAKKFARDALERAKRRDITIIEAEAHGA